MSDWHFPRPNSQAKRGHNARPDGDHVPESTPLNQRATTLWEGFLAPSQVSRAWDRVRRNGGAPGVDDRRIADVEPVFAAEWLGVRHALQDETWQPLPVRRVSLPKPGGGLRKLGIPAVMDRVVHHLLTQALTPLWEPRFSPRSFAYRPGRGVRAALASLCAQAETIRAPWAWRLDIREFFDRVPRSQALRAIRRVTGEARVTGLVERILDAGAFERGCVVPTPNGLPQGSPLSPLLANAVLHPLDLWLAQELPSFIRYADDITVLLPGRLAAHPPLSELRARLALLGLELNPEKTALTPLEDAGCLGFSFWQDEMGHWRRRIAPSSWGGLERELHRRQGLLWSAFATDDNTPQDYLTGWLAHYGATEHPEDHARLADLRARLGMERGRATTGTAQDRSHAARRRIHMPYDGSSPHHASPHDTENPTPSAPSGSARQSSPSQTSAASLWRQTLRVWWQRLQTGRLIRVGLDFQRHRRHLLPRPSTLRVSILGFTFRFRM